MEAAEAKALLVERVVLLATARREKQLALIPHASDPAEIQKAKKERLLLKLQEWAADPVLFIRENAWVADRRNKFGSEDIPSGLSPRGMVPLIPFAKLNEVVRAVDAAFESGEEVDVFIDKPRQFALTTTLFGWWLLHKWLFRKSFSFVIGSGKGPDEIDAGGKGKRDDTSLFGRLRMFLDAFLWNFSVPHPDGTRESLLKFNQHMKPTGNPRYPAQKRAQAEWRKNFTGLSDSDDSKNYLSRPKWLVHGIEMFPEAEGNWLVGETPGASFARSKSGTGAGIDEFPHCNENIGPDVDRLSWASCAVNTRFRLAIGTWPRGGSSGTEMYRRLRQRDSTTRFIHVHWTDLPVYLFGAHWNCPLCGHANEWNHTESTGHDGVTKECSGCLKSTRVTRFIVTSPWYRDACARLSNDRVSIASEILNDPEGTVEDRLFNPWRAETGVRPVTVPRHQLAMIEGFDPGITALNPACWLLGALDVKAMRIHLVGYWMAAESFIEWWVPFIKRWTPEQMRRMKPIYGKRSESPTWMQAFDYHPKALEMLDRVSKRIENRLRYPLGMIGGDKYGDHRAMMESPYDRLREYGIDVFQEYTSDRAALVQSGIEWSSRVTIDPEIADIEPPGPLGPLPSLRMVFEAARSKPYTGQSSYKLDVDKQEPQNVSHAVDAFLYMIRLLDKKVRAVVTAGGDWAQEGGYLGERSEPWRYAGGGGGIGL